MEIFPAIDIRAGRCVRLAKGDFAAAKVYADDPLAQAAAFADAGAAWLHLVDLDGAQAGGIRQESLITALARETPLKIQTGGGIRDERTIERLLNAGVARVVVGSLAATDQPRVAGWLRAFGPERIVLALDVRVNGETPEVLVHGWQAASGQSLSALVDGYLAIGPLGAVLCTDTDRDGMLAGTNLALYETMRRRWPDLAVLASGGITSPAELRALGRLGLAGAIVGKALYEGRIDLRTAIAEARRAG
jgi:phosphoribosylformimino-5-aminoimidazole carboxamide ribotide isomerase